MRKPFGEEAARWLQPARDEYADDNLRRRARLYLASFTSSSLSRRRSRVTSWPPPGGIPSRFYDDSVEAADASRLASGVLDLVSRKLGS